jgi:bisphosphoglycerate-dependent phosphoglycerate mutase
MIEQLKKLPDKSNIACLIRHADRDEFPPNSLGNEVPLNPKGINNALQFGKKLKHFTIHKIFTSPVERCVQTAQLIQEGIEKYLPIIQAKELGNPGLHIQDAELAGKIFLQYDYPKIYQKFVHYQVLEGFTPHQTLKQNLLNLFLNKFK